MTREEIEQVFEWLEENVNKSKILCFKMSSDSNITAYFKFDTGRHAKAFAQFYPKQILKVIRSEFND